MRSLSLPMNRLGNMLRQRVTVLQRSVTVGDTGEQIETWAPLAGHSSLVAFSSRATGGSLGIQLIEKPQDIPLIQFQTCVLSGYYPEIGTAHRARIDGNDWQILAVVHDSQRNFTELTIRLVVV